jgi:outer membrane protein OmpA-like peptidoglycan-associated protein
MRNSIGSFLVLAAVSLAPSAFAEDKSYEIKAPSGNWQVPGEIKQPTGSWQVPGDIQIPSEFQTVGEFKEDTCEVHMVAQADALFEFDKADLTPKALESLQKLADAIGQLEATSITVEGHTDAKGSEDYNNKLSLARALAVKTQLARAKPLSKLPFGVEGHGEGDPVAPNTNPDGSDSPEGRAKNRRVEVVLRRCH